MTREIFAQIVKEAQEALVRYHILDALFLMESLLREIDDSEMQREYESINRDYNAMLDFLSNGGKDPSQNEMQGKMARKAYLLLNRVDEKHRQTFTDDFLAQSLHSLYEPAEGVQTKMEEAFKIALTCQLTNQAKLEESRQVLEQSTPNERKMMLSGLSLSLWNYLEPNKLSLLMEYASSEPRALLGIVMTAIRHANAIPLFPESEEQLRQICQTPAMQDGIARINREIFMSSQSEQIESKIRREIIPNLIEGARDERVRMGFEMDEDDNDAFEKMLKQQQRSDDPKLERKKKQFMDSAMALLDMQKEGVDINMEMFVNGMRHAFFSDIAHWFMPFDVHDEHISHITYPNGKPNILLKLVLEQGHMCDIDCYALIFMLGETFKNGQIQQMMQMMQDRAIEAEAVAGGDYGPRLQKPEEEFSHCIRAFYRLFVKSRWKKQMSNLFDFSFNMLENPYLRLALQERTEQLDSLAKLMFKYGKSAEALAYMKQKTAVEGSTVETLQTMALCLQGLGKFRQAIDMLIQADMLDPDNTWTLGQMLNCYGHLKDDEQHLECLLQLEKLMPESSKITIETGLCLMKLERYQEAAKRFFKLEVEEKKIVPSMRAIAWCSFKQQKYEQALRYYKKLYNTPGAATWEDYLNGGHAAWLIDDTTSALTFYHQYVKRYLTDDAKITDALLPFDNDSEELQKHGKTQRDIDLMHDMLSR